ncbi:MAG: RNA methyltransferase, partial [Patescibacteria group bacterium]
MSTEQRLAKLKKAAEARQKDLAVVLEDIHDPHNAAAVFRTCDALGIQNVYLIFEEEKSFNPRRVGKVSSSSANKWLDFYVYHSTKECLRELKKAGYRIFATALAPGARSIFKTNFKNQKVALLLGNEHRGLSARALELADKKVILTMRGLVQSLNL